MFSVIIPLYNKAAYVGIAIQSILNQTFTFFEIIIVNDGSTDESLKKATGFTDPRIRVLNQSNSGVSTARNNGVKEAVYNYIAFLDADDWWDPNYLDEMVALIEKYPDAGLYGCKYKQVKNGQEKEALIGIPNDFNDGYINYFEVYAKTMWMPLFPSSAIVPRRVFKEMGGFKPALKLGEDFDLWVRIALRYPVAYLNKALVYYNQDVEVNYRGVNPGRIYEKQEHYLFSLGQFEQDEQDNQGLKKLLDRQRGEGLLKYHLAGIYSEEVNEMLKKIDLTDLPRSLRWKYRLPVAVVRRYQKFKSHLSAIKQYLLLKYHNHNSE